MADGPEPRLDASPHVSDEVRQATRCMHACRRGINEHMRREPIGAKQVSCFEGNRGHPVNRGVLRAKGLAGIMQRTSPARLRRPLKRAGRRGSGEFQAIGRGEALAPATDWPEPVRRDDPARLALFTGRDRPQSPTSWRGQQYDTPNFAAHGGLRPADMAAAGIYPVGGALWEFGSPDWERTKLFMIFGGAEDHDSNPIKIGNGKFKTNGAKLIGVNPVRTGYYAVAGEWIGITLGTGGLFILALVHELPRTGHVDLDYLCRRTNAPYPAGRNPGENFGLFVRDSDGKPLARGRVSGQTRVFDRPELKPELNGDFPALDGGRAAPVFELMALKYLAPEYSPDAVAGRCGNSAATIKRLAAEISGTAFSQAFEIDRTWTGFRSDNHEKFTGCRVSFHTLRGISAHSNGFQTGRAAWYGLWAKSEKAEPGAEVSGPRLGRQKSPVGQGPDRVAYREGWE